MKKMFNAILLAMLVVPIFVQNAQGFTWPGTDEPENTGGDGFVEGDACGYVYAVADVYPVSATGTVNFAAVTDTDQGCVDENGYFYSSSTRESYARYTRTGYSTTYTLDFDYNTTSNVFVDPTTGEWSGAARITNGTGIPSNQRWVDFDWDCSDSCALDPDDYHVYTDMTTGEVNGYAWSDYFNSYIGFTGLTQELPARDIITYVDVLANETTDGPDDVDYTDAPLADGAEFWRVRVQFLDTATGEFLTADDISMMNITITDTSDSNVYFNQVTNTLDAIETSYYNPLVGCTSSTSYCAMTEDDGSTSFNKFIYSGSPTSNMLGDDDDTDLGLEYPSDRDGCRWIYEDQGTGTCTPTSYDKSEVFYDRSNSRNKYEIDYITMQVEFAGTRETSMYTYPSGWSSDDGSTAFIEADDDVWRYYPGEDLADLSFRPRYQIEKFVAIFDGVENTAISEDPTKVMSLKTEATVLDSSAAFLARNGALKPSYMVYYQMDATSSSDQSSTNDIKLLMDTDVPPSGPTSEDVEETKRSDTINAPTSPATAYNAYARNYPIAYGQTATYSSTCGTTGYAPCTASTNTVSDPTAEQWVCDNATETTMGEVSCYYTAYLEHIDRHDEAQSMLVIGAINSVIDADEVLSEISDDNGTVLSVQGSLETINLRNKMYAQGVRYALGKTATSGSFDSAGAVSSGLVELLNDRLVFAEGDVTIDGFDGSDKTLFVIGGDVFINTDITNGRLGIIAFKRDGVGGNVYVDNEVTNLQVNMFLDGSLFSYSGIAPAGTVPTYTSDELRLERLMHQLHLKGSLVSRNTVNGSEGSDINEDGVYTYDLGDGTTTTDYDTAREYDLNMLRQFRLCHPVVDGVPNTLLTEECEEGEELSTYGEANGYYNSFILEYDPADQLPIFQVEYGLFN